MADASYAKMSDDGSMEPPFPLNKLDTDKDGLLAGLTDDQATKMEERYGLNEVPEVKEPLWKLFFKQFTGPMQIMIEAAAILCVSIQNWPDFTIIVVLLMTNGTLGFFEEKSAQASVDALKAGLEKKIPTKRNGKFDSLLVRLLVPGDVIFMRGGDIVPADCYFLEGDPCQCDEAALTGESLPVKVPRKDEKDKPYTGRRMWSGSILRVGETHAVVSHTGVYTMIGEAAKAIQEAGGKEIGVFEGKIIKAAQVLILMTAVVVIMLFVDMYNKKVEIPEILEMCLSLVIASVPVALPMVMKVTLSIGAKEMADEGGIVTHLTALEEIASMKVLCSDKTGTLTTAMMTVYYDSTARVYNGFTAEQVLEFASLASNDANKDDPIDSAVLRAYAQMKKAKSIDEAVTNRKKQFTLDRDGFVGFNAIVKRTCASVTGADGKKYFCSKGMVDVILKTHVEDEGIQWTVENYDKYGPEVMKADADLGISGFKTLAVCVAVNGGPKKIAGILPIMDPPRHDTKETVHKIKGASVAVKMITGDHFNIGKELARQIDLGTEILTPDAIKGKGREEKDRIVLQADGFAKVKPLDKHEIVTILQDRGMVVGMTGDGVNDAPALAKAQIGIAVHGATDAAKSAGDIVLTKDGLSPIFTAIQISRRIFKRLKSYVIYRICITVQVVFFLAALALVYDLRFKALYIILLALFHDLQIVTIAYDHQVAGTKPETPTVLGLIICSYAMGILMFIQTMMVVDQGHKFLSDTYKDAFLKTKGKNGVEMAKYVETVIFLQISNSSAILILSARTVGFFFSTAPAWQLLFSTVLGQLAINICVFFPPMDLVSKLEVMDVALIWGYDFCWLIVLDIVKMTANALWEKLKPADIDSNPALSEKKRMSRRGTNSFHGPAMAGANAGTATPLTTEAKKRASYKT